MKRIYTLIMWALCLYSTAAFATIHTVSNNPNRPAQYDNVQAAINAAEAGDTIYVHGSQFTYPDFIINKQLVLIGAGYRSDNEFNLETRVERIRFFRDTGLQNASGSVITGFRVNNRLGNGIGSLSVDNITIFRNFIGYLTLFDEQNGNAGLCNNWQIFNNVINTIQGRSFASAISTSPTNIVIQNNILRLVLDFSSNTVIMDHNIFYGANNLNGLFYTVITNNIFMRSTGNIFANANVSFNTFNNNFSLLSTISPTAPTDNFSSQSNTAANNILPGANPFINASNLNAYDVNANYRISASSPASGEGTDGTDLGIYGGAFPYPSGGAPGSGFDTSPLPPIPQVTEMNISNTTIQPGTDLNVNVKARINN